MNKTKKLIVLGACTLMLCGCGKVTPTLSDGSQAVASFTDNVLNVSANDLYSKMKESYALDSLITLMDTKILEQKYPDKLSDAKSSAESTVKSMKETYGEDQITYYYGSVDNYTKSVYLSNLRNYAILDYAKTQVSDKEKKSYYDKNIYGDVTVRHILITTGVTDDTKDDEKTKLEEAAKKKANEVIEKLNKADNKLETFKTLAKEYSNDDATKDNGGSLGAINTGTLSNKYDELLKSARNLKDGEYSKSIITTELGYHIIYRESSSEKPSFKDKESEITETLAKNLIDSDKTIQITALDKMRKDAGMDILDSDIKSKYSNYIANQITQAKNNSSKN